jgi:hypothetical protein
VLAPSVGCSSVAGTGGCRDLPPVCCGSIPARCHRVMEITATERLRLRRLQADDLPAFVAYRSHPDVVRYQSSDPTYAVNDAEALLAAQAHVADHRPLPALHPAGLTPAGTKRSKAGAVAWTLQRSRLPQGSRVCGTGLAPSEGSEMD